MTTKKPASVKAIKSNPKKAEVARLEAAEQNFEEMKKGMAILIKGQITQCSRIDTAVELRNMYQSYFDEAPEASLLMAYIDLMIETYTEIGNRIAALEFESFKQADIVDPFDDMLPVLDAEDEDADIFTKFVKFNCIRPYGEKLEQAHRLVVDTINGKQ